MGQSISVLGINVDDFDMREVIARIETFIENYPKEQVQEYVTTLNTDFITQSQSWNFWNQSQSKLLDVYRYSAITIPDGMPVVWMGRLLGRNLKERVTGVDLTERLSKKLGENRGRVFLMGGEGNLAEKAGEVLSEKCPGLQIVGVANPYIDLKCMDSPSIIDKINKASPDILFLNLGCPKQELWFQQHRHKLKVPVTIGVGGAFAFIAGKVPRAPKYMQRLGLEWLYRLYLEPARLWKRYLYVSVKLLWQSIPLFVCFVMQKISLYFLNESSQKVKCEGEVIFLPKVINEEVAENLESKVLGRQKVRLDFQASRIFDSLGISKLVRILLRNDCLVENVGWLLKLQLKAYWVWGIFEDLSTGKD